MTAGWLLPILSVVTLLAAALATLGSFGALMAYGAPMGGPAHAVLMKRIALIGVLVAPLVLVMAVILAWSLRARLSAAVALWAMLYRTRTSAVALPPSASSTVTR